MSRIIATINDGTRLTFGRIAKFTGIDRAEVPALIDRAVTAGPQYVNGVSVTYTRDGNMNTYSNFYGVFIISRDQDTDTVPGDQDQPDTDQGDTDDTWQCPTCAGIKLTVLDQGTEHPTEDFAVCASCARAFGWDVPATDTGDDTDQDQDNAVTAITRLLNAPIGAVESDYAPIKIGHATAFLPGVLVTPIKVHDDAHTVDYRAVTDQPDSTNWRVFLRTIRGNDRTSVGTVEAYPGDRAHQGAQVSYTVTLPGLVRAEVTPIGQGWACGDCALFLANGELDPELSEDEARNWEETFRSRNPFGSVTVDQDTDQDNERDCDTCGTRKYDTFRHVTFWEV